MIQYGMPDLAKIFEPEDLNPELAECFVDDPFPMVRHPLVYSIYHSPNQNRMVNLQLHHKKLKIAEHEAHGDFDKIMALYERPYRLDALVEYADRMTDQQYWTAVNWIWSDTENLHQNYDTWMEVVTSGRAGREFLMTKEDRAMYDALPEVVTVYRGQMPHHEIGLSWSTKRTVAEFFARRWKQKGSMIYTGRVLKKDIIACFVGRNEFEVVALPQDMQLIAEEWT